MGNQKHVMLLQDGKKSGKIGFHCLFGKIVKFPQVEQCLSAAVLHMVTVSQRAKQPLDVKS